MKFVAYAQGGIVTLHVILGLFIICHYQAKISRLSTTFLNDYFCKGNDIPIDLSCTFC